MAVWWVPGTRAALPRAVIYIPGTATKDKVHRALTHCQRRAYHVVAVADGRTGWDAARCMLRQRHVSIIVTVRGGPPASAEVEIARRRELRVVP